MKVQDVIDMAISSELSNLSTKNNTTTILSFINLGMIELYKRFPIATEEYVITLLDGITIYQLPSDFMWLQAAYGEVTETDKREGTVSELPLNEEDNPFSINLVSWNKVQVPLAATGSFVSVIYAASPVTLTDLSLGDDIQIPPQLVEALLSYIGFRASAPTDGEGEKNSYYRRFELSCVRAKEQGMYTADDLTNNNKMNRRGFV